MVTIIEVPVEDGRVQALIAVQKAYSIAHTPPGSGHAFEAGSQEEGRFFLALEEGEPASCIALKRLGPSEGEIKTMHVHEARRGRGIASALVRRLIAEARSGGLITLKLETGPDEHWAASRRVYEKAGFVPCEKYGEYASDPYSCCMELRF